MALAHSPRIVTDGLTFYYDNNNISKSWKGAPTTNLITTTPISISLYAYVTGPVTTTNITNANYRPQTVYRYTIDNAINTARAAIRPSGLTTGVNYSFSCKIKYNGNNTNNPSFAIDSSKGFPEGGANNNTISSSNYTSEALGNDWWYIKFTWSYSSCPTSSCILTFGVNTGSDTSYIGNTFDVYEPQFEINSFATPYINGVRSDTQAILDLTNNNTITANSLTYNSDGSFSFNGSDNYLSIPVTDSLNFSSSFTLEAWINPSTYTGDIIILGQGSYYLTMNGSYQLAVYCYGKSPAGYHTTTETLSQNSWNHICACWSASEVSLYINGQFKKSVATTGTPNSVNTQVWIGSEYNGTQRSFNGKISSAKIYARALTVDEVKQNFNALRGRYGL